MPITPIEQYLASSIAGVFGGDQTITGLLGMFLLSTMFFLLRPPFSVAVVAVGLMGIVIFGTVAGGVFGMGYAPYIYGGIIFLFFLVLYWGWKRSRLASDY